MVGLGGLEPPTSPLSGARSSHLSYRPIYTVATTVSTLPYQGKSGNSEVLISHHQWLDRNACFRESLADCSGNFRGARSVTVNADGVCLKGHGPAV
jgi:hypothetical protein